MDVSMRDETGRQRRSIAVVGLQRTQSVRIWFTERRKKGKRHTFSMSAAQLLDSNSKVTIGAKIVPPVERRTVDAEFNERDSFPTKKELERRRSVYMSYEQPSKALLHQSSSISRTERRRLPAGGIQVTRRSTCNKCPYPGSSQQHNTRQPRGPIPPRRSSSLPKESRIIEAISNPAAPLTTFFISPQDGYYLEYLLTGSLNKLEVFSMPQLWPMILDRFHSEPCVRHIMLGSAMIHRSRSDTNISRLEEAHRLASRHYSSAVGLLSNSLSMMKNGLGEETREVILLTTFLLAVFELLRKKDERASWWMKSGTKLLKIAQHKSNSNATEPRYDRNTAQLALGYRLMDVNLKVKMMRTQKKQKRSLGKFGSGGI